MAKTTTPAREWTIDELEKDGMAFAVRVDGELVTRFEERSSAAAYVKEQNGGTSPSSSSTRPAPSSPAETSASSS